MLEIPPSTTIISVKAINVGSPETALPASYAFEPVLPGYEVFTSPIYAFLLEHPSGKRLFYDLGIRQDQEAFSPVNKALLKIWKDAGLCGIVFDKDVGENLTLRGLSPKDIDVVIWSHSHIDHIGDMALFPTELIVGPGTGLRTYPTTPDATLIESDLKGHKVTELQDFSLTISGIRALDYFCDGSLYILDAPGHCPGHVMALVRVTQTSSVYTDPLTARDCGEDSFDNNNNVFVILAHDITMLGGHRGGG
ncbi:hypothetical protein BDZ89DRAFT_1245249 [Hymenopellis radicata]|nr:hypothetical protein BDZ89DRAFT_1245249 [Hymenopellis radicata]